MIGVWTDGCCLRNPGGPGGWAAILVGDGVEIARATGYAKATTNNRMELAAAIGGLGLAADHHVRSACVVSDSQYVVFTATRGWRRRKNIDLWTSLDAIRGPDVTWRWVRGHNGSAWNELADRLARQAARGRVPG